MLTRFESVLVYLLLGTGLVISVLFLVDMIDEPTSDVIIENENSPFIRTTIETEVNIPVIILWCGVIFIAILLVFSLSKKGKRRPDILIRRKLEGVVSEGEVLQTENKLGDIEERLKEKERLLRGEKIAGE